MFIRDPETDTVLCPQGQTLRRKAIKKGGVVRYCNKAACKACVAKCTVSAWKEIDFPEGVNIKPQPGRKRRCDSEHP